MAPLKKKGDLAELKIATDLLERGYGIAIPFGEDCDFDLIAYRDDELHRVQVKHACSDGAVVPVRCDSASLTNGKVRKRKRYTARTIDWISVWDATTDACFYVPAVELGNGRRQISLRLSPSKNNQMLGVRDAEQYTRFGNERCVHPEQMRMEPAGFEPAASGVANADALPTELWPRTPDSRFVAALSRGRLGSGRSVRPGPRAAVPRPDPRSGFPQPALPLRLRSSSSRRSPPTHRPVR